MKPSTPTEIHFWHEIEVHFSRLASQKQIRVEYRWQGLSELLEPYVVIPDYKNLVRKSLALNRLQKKGDATARAEIPSILREVGNLVRHVLFPGDSWAQVMSKFRQQMKAADCSWLRFAIIAPKDLCQIIPFETCYFFEYDPLYLQSDSYVPFFTQTQQEWPSAAQERRKIYNTWFAGQFCQGIRRHFLFQNRGVELVYRLPGHKRKPPPCGQLSRRLLIINAIPQAGKTLKWAEEQLETISDFAKQNEFEAEHELACDEIPKKIECGDYSLIYFLGHCSKGKLLSPHYSPEREIKLIELSPSVRCLILDCCESGWGTAVDLVESAGVTLLGNRFSERDVVAMQSGRTMFRHIMKADQDWTTLLSRQRAELTDLDRDAIFWCNPMLWLGSFPNGNPELPLQSLPVPSSAGHSLRTTLDRLADELVRSNTMAKKTLSVWDQLAADLVQGGMDWFLSSLYQLTIHSQGQSEISRRANWVTTNVVRRRSALAKNPQILSNLKYLVQYGQDHEVRDVGVGQIAPAGWKMCRIVPEDADHSAPIRAMQWDPSGHRLIAVDSDGKFFNADILRMSCIKVAPEPRIAQGQDAILWLANLKFVCTYKFSGQFVDFWDVSGLPVHLCRIPIANVIQVVDADHGGILLVTSHSVEQLTVEQLTLPRQSERKLQTLWSDDALEIKAAVQLARDQLVLLVNGSPLPKGFPKLGIEFRSMPSDVQGSFRTCGGALVSGGSACHLWNYDQKILYRYDSGKTLSRVDRAFAGYPASDGQGGDRLACRLSRTRICIADVNHLNAKEFLASAAVTAMAMTADGDKLACGLATGEIEIHHLDSGGRNRPVGAKQILISSHPGYSDLAPAVSPNAQWIAWVNRFDIRLRCLQANGSDAIVPKADGEIVNTAASDSGSLALAYSGGWLSLYLHDGSWQDVDTGRRQIMHMEWCRPWFSRDELLAILFSSGELVVWDRQRTFSDNGLTTLREACSVFTWMGRSGGILAAHRNQLFELTSYCQHSETGAMVMRKYRSQIAGLAAADHHFAVCLSNSTLLCCARVRRLDPPQQSWKRSGNSVQIAFPPRSLALDCAGEMTAWKTAEDELFIAGFAGKYASEPKGIPLADPTTVFAFGQTADNRRFLVLADRRETTTIQLTQFSS